MTEFITQDEVAERAKIPGAIFPIKGTVYPKEGGAYSGEGTLKRIEDEFVLKLTFPIGAEAPEAKGGIYTRDELWRFEGVLGRNLPFVVEHLAPWGTRHWNNGITSQEFDTQTICFRVLGNEKSAVRDGGELLERLEPDVKLNDGEVTHGVVLDESDKEGIAPGADTAFAPRIKPMPGPSTVQSATLVDETQKPSPYVTGIWMHALVLNFPLIHTNGGTEFTEKNDFVGESRMTAADTFSGSFDGVEFGLVQRDKDLKVYLFLPHVSDEGVTVQTHEQFLTAFLTGLAFATGQHCWPYRVTIRRKGVQIFDKLHAVRELDRTSLAPFSERIGFNAAIGRIEWQFSDFLGKATQFFNAKTTLSEAAAKALWLLRAAGAKKIPSEITLSSLCVLLESLTGLIFSELKLDSEAEKASFEEAKNEVKAWLEKHSRISEAGFSRLRNLVGSASLLRPVDKYRAVCDHFGLQWHGLMYEAWETWVLVRHKSVHAALGGASKIPVDAHFTALGRIAGAINILALRLIGYSGITRTSVFEDKHHKI